MVPYGTIKYHNDTIWYYDDTIMVRWCYWTGQRRFYRVTLREGESAGLFLDIPTTQWAGQCRNWDAEQVCEQEESKPKESNAGSDR